MCNSTKKILECLDLILILWFNVVILFIYSSQGEIINLKFEN